jgi:hypothetical protein
LAFQARGTLSCWWLAQLESSYISNFAIIFWASCGSSKKYFVNTPNTRFLIFFCKEGIPSLLLVLPENSKLFPLTAATNISWSTTLFLEIDILIFSFSASFFIAIITPLIIPSFKEPPKKVSTLFANVLIIDFSSQILE